MSLEDDHCRHSKIMCKDRASFVGGRCEERIRPSTKVTYDKTCSIDPTHFYVK